MKKYVYYSTAGIFILFVASLVILFFNTNDKQEMYPIAVTDQAAKQIRIYPAHENWNEEQPALWSWRPSSGNGFKGLTWGWGLPNGVKLRQNDVLGGQHLVITDSKGLAAIISYPNADMKWAKVVGGDPHAAELLPNGNIAVAASKGGWVRVYASSQSPEADHYAEYKLPGAHGVLWDPIHEVLWALGDYLLVSLKVEGNEAKPTLEVETLKNLPSPWGHDLQPVHGNEDRLWVTTGSRVYQYVKSSGKFEIGYPGYEQVNQSNVKSIGNQLNGQIVLTRPSENCANDWCTDSINFYMPDFVRTLTGAQLYKARILNPEYH